MPTRQDQLHSYQFMIQRVVAALVMRETDPAQSPFRRAVGATLASVLVSAILLGGSAAWGVIRGAGGANWKEQPAVLVEKETGARYVHLDGTLHPVINYSSAVLLAGATKTVSVSRRDLEGEQRGHPLGIPDAPDSLPAADRLLRSPWTLCTTIGLDTDRVRPRSTLSIGKGPDGGTPLGDRAVLARVRDGTVHLVWKTRRHPVPASDVDMVRKLVGAGTEPALVSAAFLNSLEVGPAIGRIRLRDHGAQSRTVPGRRIGEVIVVQNQSNRRHAVVVADGLAAISPLQADLLLSDRDYQVLTGRAGETAMSPALFATHPEAASLMPGPTAPDTVPALADVSTGSLCAVVHDGSAVAEIRVGAVAPAVAPGGTTPERTPAGGVLVDHVDLTAGRGALVEAIPAPGATGGTVSIVTDLGLAYPISDPAAVKAILGYPNVQPVQMPVGLVSLIPIGPGLDPDAARQPVRAD